MEALKKLKKWLKLPGNSKAKLAYLLEYETSTAISQWIVRNHIPKYQQAQVLEIIGPLKSPFGPGPGGM